MDEASYCETRRGLADAKAHFLLAFACRMACYLRIFARRCVRFRVGVFRGATFGALQWAPAGRIHQRSTAAFSL
jgi:hypothetical protein